MHHSIEAAKALLELRDHAFYYSGASKKLCAKFSIERFAAYYKLMQHLDLLELKADESCNKPSSRTSHYALSISKPRILAS